MLSTLFSTTVLFFPAILSFAVVGAILLPALCLGGCAKRDLEARAVNLLSPIDLSGFTSFTQFTRAVYCPQSKIKNWNCRGKLSLFLICDQDQCLGGWGTGSLFPSFQEPAVRVVLPGTY